MCPGPPEGMDPAAGGGRRLGARRGAAPRARPPAAGPPPQRGWFLCLRAPQGPPAEPAIQPGAAPAHAAGGWAPLGGGWQGAGVGRGCARGALRGGTTMSCPSRRRACEAGRERGACAPILWWAPRAPQLAAVPSIRPSSRCNPAHPPTRQVATPGQLQHPPASCNAAPSTLALSGRGPGPAAAPARQMQRCHCSCPPARWRSWASCSTRPPALRTPCGESVYLSAGAGTLQAGRWGQRGGGSSGQGPGQARCCHSRCQLAAGGSGRLSSRQARAAAACRRLQRLAAA